MQRRAEKREGIALLRRYRCDRIPPFGLIATGLYIPLLYLACMQTKPRIILCADDRELLCETATRIDPSVKVITAVHGDDLLTKLKELDAADLLPCLIILDMNMPIMDGKVTLAEIRKHRDWDAIPIALFTTSPRNMYTDLEQQYGVSIVTKPAKYAEIMKEVTQLLSYCKAA